jgi:hypothetical protein
VTACLFRREEREILQQERTRPDETHFPLQHIPQLRQLVQTRCSQPFAELGEAFGIGKRQAGGIVPVNHRAELDECERASIKAGSGMPEKYR